MDQPPNNSGPDPKKSNGDMLPIWTNSKAEKIVLHSAWTIELTITRDCPANFARQYPALLVEFWKQNKASSIHSPSEVIRKVLISKLLSTSLQKSKFHSISSNHFYFTWNTKQRRKQYATFSKRKYQATIHFLRPPLSLICKWTVVPLRRL